jgi:hypothetical protein
MESGSVDFRQEICSDPHCSNAKTDSFWNVSSFPTHYHVVYYNPKTKKEYRKYGFCRICHQSYRTMKSITGEYCRQHRGISMKPNTSCDICGDFTRHRKKQDLFNLGGFYCLQHVVNQIQERITAFRYCMKHAGRLSPDLINHICIHYLKYGVFWRYRKDKKLFILFANATKYAVCPLACGNFPCSCYKNTY